MEHEVKDHVDVKNIFRPDGMGGFPGLAGFGGAGAAWGLGGLVAGALLSRNGNGLFGGNNGDGAGSAINQLTLNQVQKTLGDIQGSIPLSASQTENVICNQTNVLTNSLAQLALGLQQGLSNVKDQVVTTGAANLVATNNVNQNVLLSQAATQAAICADGDRTRALIQSINDANLNRLISTQAAEIIELRNEHRRQADTAGIRIDMINNQNQLQQQQQAQGFALNTLATHLAGVEQLAHATNTQVIAGNTGAVRGGNQTANPTNVKA